MPLFFLKIKRTICSFLVHAYSVLSYALSFLFEDECCVFCGKKTAGIPICSLCLKSRILCFDITRPRCALCGKPLFGEEKLCLECRSSPVISHADMVVPIFQYELFYKNLVFEWKHQEKRLLALNFAKVIDLALKQLSVGDNAVIVNVPPRKGKIKEKGWDQIKDICFILDNVYGYDCKSLLERRGRNQQKHKSREQRLEESKNEYSASKKLKILQNRKKVPEEVILIDDVLTTGSTVESCAQILKEYGIAKVKVIILFIVD